MVAEIFLDKAIFDTLADRNSNFSFLVFLIILLFITMGSNIAYMHWYNDHYSIYSNAFIKSKIKEKVYEKLSNVDLESYDNPKFYNNQIWISENCDEKYIQILNSFFMLINAAASCVAVVVSAITFEPVLLIFSLIYIIISITVNKVYSKLKFEFEKNSVEIKRKLIPFWLWQAVFLPHNISQKEFPEWLFPRLLQSTLHAFVCLPILFCKGFHM